MRWRWGLGVVVVAMTMGGGAPAKDYPLRVTISGVKPKYALGDSVALRAQATFGGPKAQLSYRWFASDGPGLPFDMDTSQQKISIPGEELVPGASYTVGVEVQASWTDEDADPPEQMATAQSQVTFVVNQPPAGGECELEIDWAGPAQASVTITASGWEDDDAIQYRYLFERNGERTLLYNWTHLKSHRTATIARPGDKLQAVCEVRDALGDGVEKRSDPVERPE